MPRSDGSDFSLMSLGSAMTFFQLRPSSSFTGALTTITVALLTACGDDRSAASDYALDASITWTSKEVESDQPFAEPFLIAEIGDLEGPLAFGHFGPASVSPDGSRLALVDEMTCEIALFEYVEGQFVLDRRVGRCGEGPGEYRRIASISYDGDQLLVFDGESSRLTTISRSGEVTATRNIPRPQETGFIHLPRRAAQTASGTLVQWELVIQPTPPDTLWQSTSPVVALLDEQDAFAPVLTLKDITTRTIDRRGNTARGVEWCIHSNGQMVAFGSRSRPHLLTMDVTDGLAVMSNQALEDIPISQRVQREGTWVPGAVTTMGCLDDWIIYRVSGLEEDAQVRMVEWWLSYDGTSGWVTEIGRGEPRDRADRIRTAAGRFLVTVSNFETDWPIAYIWRI